jgi:hypothetical protein
MVTNTSGSPWDMKGGIEQTTDSDGEACNVIWYFDRSRSAKIIIKISPTSPSYNPAKPTSSPPLPYS